MFCSGSLEGKDVVTFQGTSFTDLRLQRNQRNNVNVQPKLCVSAHY